MVVVSTESVAPPAITSPAQGARLGSPIVIRSKATPGHRVEVQVDYQGAVLVFSLKGTYGQVTTIADAAGDWTVRINETVRISNAELTITAVAIDPLAGAQRLSRRGQRWPVELPKRLGGMFG